MKPHYFRLARRGLSFIFCFWLVLSSPARGGQIVTAQNTVAQNPVKSGAEKTAGLKPILEYISSAWDTLTRSMSECQSLVDPKIKAAPVLYLPAGFTEPDALKNLSSKCDVRVEHLPIVIHHLGEVDTAKIQPPGLLYLEHKYVVPGGRFNEMYGWDSYFIIRGLLRSGRVELARGMVDNFFFEVENYGAMLNANRTYYLTRSQPPFLSSMFVDVYDALQKTGHADPVWLTKAYADLEKDYEMWNRDPHLAGDTGLSRYYDFGEGPPQEALQDESGFYRKVATYFFFHPAQADSYIHESLSAVTDSGAVQSGAAQPGTAQPGLEELIAGAPYTLQICDVSHTMARAGCDEPHQYKLSSDYYKGDRSMRESGFDVSFRFAPFGAATQHYAPVCLNSLLYKTEKDMEQISRWLGRSADADKWSRRAEKRKQLITQYLWDDKAGFFFDYNLITNQKSSYRYATTLYPLWAGLATPEQARAVAKNLITLERPGGLAMSTEDSGAQWDLPYGWGNIEMLSVEGLRHYGLNADADRISYEFLSMVAENFRRDGYIVEKYNVVTRSSDAHAELGYKMNVVGFGWTNGAFLVLLHDLPHEMVERLAAEQDRPLPAPSQ
ncbi:MAG: trehalase family glycosidase [Candidatus Sulfotelmatobacter sp.]